MSPVTPLSLLEKLREGGDDAAWQRFYAFYAPLIVGFCLQKGCSRAMADDILQETMVALLRQMPTFTYDPRRGHFRSFVLKIVHRLAIKAWHRESRYVAADSGSQADWVANVADSQAAQPGPDWDALLHQRLLRDALERVRERVNPQVYRSFELTAIHGRPAAEVMAELGIPSANAVYQHRNRVMRYLEETVAELRQEMDP
jgi:RNA polymerase sigma factor (sigma-70 family)